MIDIEQNLARVRTAIELHAKAYGRDPGEITLLAVSKTKPAAEVRIAAMAGQHDFGESYLQEALQKQQELVDLELTWHFIGPIQANKTKPIAESFDWVHSIDRLKIARRLDRQRPPQMKPIEILLQVNIDRETSKSGVYPEGLQELVSDVLTLPRLRLRGLMAIPAPQADLEAQCETSARVHALFKDLLSAYPQCDTLSMGMSGDLQAAIAQGSTLVRIGTAIFGKRL